MQLCRLPMLLLEVGWTTVTHFSGVSLKSIFIDYSLSKIVLLEFPRGSTTLVNVLTRKLIKGWINQLERRSAIRGRIGVARGDLPFTHPNQRRASSPINDNHCMDKLERGLLAGSQCSTKQTIHLCKLSCCNTCSYCTGAAVCHFLQREYKLKHVKSVSCVTQLSCVKFVKNVKNAAQNLPVGARLQNYWQYWLNLGAGPKVVQILKEGYTIPFRTHPKLTRSPTVISCYVNPHRNLYLQETLRQLIDKNAVELVNNQQSLGFFNRLFLLPKPKPILDLSKLNLFLKVEKFKMETLETIKTPLQQGEWVTSVDFKDANFHIPIEEQSRKYLRFYVEGRTYQFKALPFGLSTAPMEFTVIAK